MFLGLGLAVSLALTTTPPVSQAVLGQKVEVIRHKNKKAAATADAPAAAAQPSAENAAKEAALNEKQSQLDAKQRALEQREEELKAKEAAEEEKKAAQAKRHAAQQKAAEEYSNQQTQELQNAANALSGGN
jgi:colicin import membrane protein